MISIWKYFHKNILNKPGQKVLMAKMIVHFKHYASLSSGCTLVAMSEPSDLILQSFAPFSIITDKAFFSQTHQRDIV